MSILELSRPWVLKDINEIIEYYWKSNVSIDVLILCFWADPAH